MRIEIGTNEAGQRLDKFLRKLLKDVPLSKIFKALRKGDVRVNGKKVSEEKKSTHSTSKPLTNCPNCGAKIKHKDKDYCEYCHTILTNKK